MSLTGLLSVITDDPQFQQVPGLAAGLAGTGLGGGADVTAPAALRPWLAAALAGVPGGASSGPATPPSASSGPATPPSASSGPATPPKDRRFLLAVTATAREAEDLAGAL